MTARENTNPPRFDVIFLDFDGVIVDSNGIKNEAFREIFSRYPSRFDELTKYHLSHNHVGRREKFDHIARRILKVDDPERWADERTSEFTAMTRKAIISCPFLPGAVEFIEQKSLVTPLVLVSATPLEELEIILHERDIRQHFELVYGAPSKKVEVFSSVMMERNWRRGIYIGDSPEDLVEARRANVEFLGIVGNTDFEGEGVPVVLNLQEAAVLLGDFE